MVSVNPPHQNTSSPTTNTLNLFGLFRHGKTLWNEEKKIQGSSDSPLTREGREMIKVWVETLRSFKWNRILASDLGRAKETVSILTHELHLPFSFDHRLSEQHWGEWEGKNLQYLRSNHREELQKQIDLGWEFRAPGGESRIEVLQRSQKALVDAAEKWPQEKILIISHQGVISCLLYHLSGRKFLPTEERLIYKNRLHTLKITGGSFHLDSINITTTAGI